METLTNLGDLINAKCDINNPGDTQQNKNELTFDSYFLKRHGIRCFNAHMNRKQEMHCKRRDYIMIID